jgi:hypothetical protein
LQEGRKKKDKGKNMKIMKLKKETEKKIEKKGP